MKLFKRSNQGIKIENMHRLQSAKFCILKIIPWTVYMTKHSYNQSMALSKALQMQLEEK